MAAKVNGGSPVGPGFVVYERAPGVQGYSLEMALSSVGPGWADLVRAWFTHMDNNNEYRQGEPTFVTQVKEKYGTLRIYFVGGSEYDLGFVSGLEAASALICEACGRRGQLQGGGWIRTECDGCRQERLGAGI